MTARRRSRQAPTVLVTGANRGIGLEFVRQYAADGWRVLATCRHPDRAGELAGVAGDVNFFALEITDHSMVRNLASDLKRESIDVLVNNAGIYGPQPMPLGGIDYDAWGEVMRVNAMAPLHLCECFVEHVARSQRRTMVALTSKMGSIADNGSGGSYLYRSSKAALNAAMKSLSIDLAPRGIKVGLLHPGWVRTDMGGPGALIDAEVSVSGMRRVIDGLSPENSGSFLNYDGQPIPW